MHEMRAERVADDANGLLLHLRTQVMSPDTLHAYTKGYFSKAQALGPSASLDYLQAVRYDHLMYMTSVFSLRLAVFLCHTALAKLIAGRDLSCLGCLLTNAACAGGNLHQGVCPQR